MQNLYLQQFRDARSKTELAVLLRSPDGGHQPLSAEKRQLVVARIQSEKDPALAESLVGYLDARELSLAEKDQITKAIRKAPEQARQRWFEATGHR